MTQKPSSTPTRFHSDADRIPPLKDCPASAHLSFPLWVRGHKVGSGKLYVHVARSSLLQQTQPKRYIRYQRGHILGGFFFFCLLLLPRGTCRIRTFTRGLIGAKDTPSAAASRILERVGAWKCYLVAFFADCSDQPPGTHPSGYTQSGSGGPTMDPSLSCAQD